MKYIIIALFALITITNAFNLLEGQYNWFTTASCVTPTLLNVTLSGQNTFQVVRASNGYEVLTNVTMNPDGITFTGLGALYLSGRTKVSAYTTIKGQFYSQYSFVAVWAAIYSPWINYPGSTQDYVLDSCYKYMETKSDFIDPTDVPHA